MERVSLFLDFYNFMSCSNEFLNQKCFLDYTKIHEYFVDKATQVYGKTYIYGGLNFGKLLEYLEHQPRIDVIRGEVGKDNKEKCTDINIATGLLTKAFHNSYDVALLFSGDRDYKKVVREIRRMGKIVGIVTPAGEEARKAKDLANNVDFHIILDEDFYKQFWESKDGSPYVSMIGKSKTVETKPSNKKEEIKVETDTKQEPQSETIKNK